jgi:hypothetical protein
MHSLHDAHEMNTYKAGHVCLSDHLQVHMIQLENRWTDLDQIWYGRYAVEVYPKIVFFSISYNR